MLHVKERVVILMIITSLIAIIFSPVKVKCADFEMTGFVQNPSGTAAENVIVFLYDWEKVQMYGLSPQALSGVPSVTISNGKIVPNLEISLNKDYLLVFSTRTKASLKSFPDFFYGKRGGIYVKDTTMDPAKAPKLNFGSSISSLGTIKLIDGFFVQGLIKDEQGAPLSGVRIEPYMDQDGSPVPVPYAFYRFVETSSAQPYNFKMGGFVPGGKYYIRVVASHLGYIDTFYTDSSGEPQLIQINTNLQDLGEIQLTQGAKIWGYIMDDQTNNPVENTVIYIQGVSYGKDQQIQFLDSYTHDPNAHLIEDLPEEMDWDKYYFKLDRIHYSPDGKYELKGLPFVDHDYYIQAVEYPTQNYATPLYYDGNDGAYSLRWAKTISLDGSGSERRIDFLLKKGSCIEGAVSYGPLPGQDAINKLNINPDVFSTIPIYVDAYRKEMDGSISPTKQNAIEGQGPYSVCGLPPGDYYIKAYDPIYKFYTEKYYDNELSYITANEITVGTTNGDPDQVEDINILLSLGGMRTINVLDQENQPISSASVNFFLLNNGNPLVGYYYRNSDGIYLAQYPALMDPNSKSFYIWGLPSGFYTVSVGGPGVVVDEYNAYLPQYYTIDPNGTMTSNKGYSIEVKGNDPNLISLRDIHLNKSGITSGGIISGNVSLAEGSSNGFTIRVFNADTGIELKNPLYRFDPNNMSSYSVMVQYDGNYILAVQDIEGNFLPHYYNSNQSTVSPDFAQVLSIESTNPDKRYLTQINFTLSDTGGRVSGQVFDQEGSGVSGLTILAKQKVVSGANKDQWINIDKTATTKSDGIFTIKGLYPGPYKFSVHDPAFIFAAQVYHSDPNEHIYTADEGEEWEFDPGDPNRLITFHIQKGGKIVGSVLNVSSAQVYAYLKGDGKTTGGYGGLADPNFSLTGLIPGKYIVCFKDVGLDYLPIYYNQAGGTTDPNLADPVTITVGETIALGQINFIEPGARIEGIVGVDLGMDQIQSLPDIYIFLYRIFSKNQPWSTEPEQYTMSDQDGGYFIEGLSSGDYWIIAFKPQGRSIYRKLTIMDSDLGDIKQDIDIIFPQDWKNQKYRHTMSLEEGLNLVAYPTLLPPSFNGYNSKSFVQDIGLVSSRMDISFKTYFAKDHIWKSTSFGNTELVGAWVTGATGDNFYLRNGQGFLFYAQQKRDIDFWYYPGQSAIWLRRGLNLAGNVVFDPNMMSFSDPNMISDMNFTTRKMLNHLEEDASTSIQTLDAKAGKWQATYWMWGRPAGADIKVEDERGYLLGIKKDLNYWYPKK